MKGELLMGGPATRFFSFLAGRPSVKPRKLPGAPGEGRGGRERGGGSLVAPETLDQPRTPHALLSAMETRRAGPLQPPKEDRPRRKKQLREPRREEAPAPWKRTGLPAAGPLPKTSSAPVRVPHALGVS